MPWSDATTSVGFVPCRQSLEVVEHIAQQGVDGADLHAVQLILDSSTEREARSVGIEVLGPPRLRKRRRHPGFRERPREVREGDVHDVQRRRPGDLANPLGEHPGLAAGTALVFAPGVPPAEQFGACGLDLVRGSRPRTSVVSSVEP